MDREVLYREFGLTLCAQRKRKHLSQEIFGAKVGLSRTSVTNVERGRQPVQLHQLYAFAEVLGIDPMKLLPAEYPSETVAQQKMEDKSSKYLAALAEVSKRE
jgi:transcriptional regulator with XRE-family HTH domain